jgi:hypothetical protein
MADDLNDGGEPDRSQVNMSEPQEVRYWTSKFDVGADTLRAAVIAVGTSADAVEKYLNRGA